MRIYFLRHSETSWNRQQRIQGHSNVPLNLNGRRIARLAGMGMADIPFDICFSSPLTRARQTAELVLRENKHYTARIAETGLNTENTRSSGVDRSTDAVSSGIIIDSRIMEIGFGVWEGLHSRPEYGEVNDEDFRDFYLRLDGTYCPPGGERLKNVVERSQSFLDELAAREDLADKTVLAVTHGCTLRCILSRFALDKADYFRHPPRVPYNCEAAIIETDADGNLSLADRGSIYYDKSLAKDFYGYVTPKD